MEKVENGENNTRSALSVGFLYKNPCGPVPATGSLMALRYAVVCGFDTAAELSQSLSDLDSDDEYVESFVTSSSELAYALSSLVSVNHEQENSLMRQLEVLLSSVYNIGYQRGSLNEFNSNRILEKERKERKERQEEEERRAEESRPIGWSSRQTRTK